MNRYALNIPVSLKQEAEEQASRQGISLNQFIMWSVSEKVATLRHMLDDPKFPGITYRRGESGWVIPVLRGTGIRVQTIVEETKAGQAIERIAEEYDLAASHIREAMRFFDVHHQEIDDIVEADQDFEK